jgi:hypothetical protein
LILSCVSNLFSLNIHFICSQITNNSTDISCPGNTYVWFISEPWTAAIWVISLFLLKLVVSRSKYMRGRRDCMVVGFTTTYAISTYHHSRWEFESHSGDTTCDQVYQWLATSRWFSPGTPRYIWNIVESGIKHHKTNQKNPKYTNDSDPSSFIGLVEGPIHQPLINFQNLQFQIDKRLAPGCMISCLSFFFRKLSSLLIAVFPSFSFLFKCSLYSFSATLFANYPGDRRAASFI